MWIDVSNLLVIRDAALEITVPELADESIREWSAPVVNAPEQQQQDDFVQKYSWNCQPHRVLSRLREVELALGFGVASQHLIRATQIVVGLGETGREFDSTL